jgi:uncharacterized DUF497 family protein
VGILWDPGKATSNVAKHGIRFAHAALVSDDPVAITVVDGDSYPIEQRFLVLGADAAGRILLVVYSWRGDDIRRSPPGAPNPHEREEYEKQ